MESQYDSIKVAAQHPTRSFPRANAFLKVAMLYLKKIIVTRRIFNYIHRYSLYSLCDKQNATWLPNSFP